VSYIGILFALAAGFVWGSGDFTGGFATRRASPYQVLALSALSGLVVLVIAALALRETLPSLRGGVWAMLGGVTGAVGIATLYYALSIGHAASIAPTAGVISAALPVVYDAFTHGLPPATRLAGFGVAMAGIWLVSASGGTAGGQTRREFLLACLAGAAFGGFFICLGLVDAGKIITPLIITRSFTLLTGLGLIAIKRLPLPALTGNPPALLAGLLDAGGNLFFILAKQNTRLDVVAVLASLYPAATVLLSALILKEKISPRQGAGVVACLAAIVLITV
jgi:drug/metabolite transporter (DMT)-like permease